MAARRKVLARLRHLATLTVAAATSTGCFYGDSDSVPLPAACEDAGAGITGSAIWIAGDGGELLLSITLVIPVSVSIDITTPHFPEGNIMSLTKDAAGNVTLVMEPVFDSAQTQHRHVQVQFSIACANGASHLELAVEWTDPAVFGRPEMVFLQVD